MPAALSIVLATCREWPDLGASDRLYAEALERRGCRVRAAVWDGPRAAFAGVDAVVIRATWDYYRTLEGFRAWTEAMAASTRLLNSLDLVRWNLRKDYIGALAGAGIRVPQSHIVAGTAAAIGAVLDETGWRRAVVKPASGASGHAVELVARTTLAAQAAALSDEWGASGVVVQEFLPEIADGELSLVYFDGTFSHAVRKRPPAGEFRSNSRYGPTRTAENLSGDIAEQGAACLRVLPEMPLYARVDAIVRDGCLIVIEVEVLEPALFLEFDPPSADRFADATLRRLARAASG